MSMVWTLIFKNPLLGVANVKWGGGIGFESQCSICLRAQSHMTSRYTWGPVTTLHGFGHFLWALTIFMGRALGLCEWKWPLLAASKLNSQWEQQWCAFLLEFLQSHLLVGWATPCLSYPLCLPASSSSVLTFIIMISSVIYYSATTFRRTATWPAIFLGKLQVAGNLKSPRQNTLLTHTFYVFPFRCCCKFPFPPKVQEFVASTWVPAKPHTFSWLLLSMFEFLGLRICCIGCCLWVPAKDSHIYVVAPIGVVILISTWVLAKNTHL